MKLKTIIFLLLSCIFNTTQAQEDGLVKWFDFKEAQELNKKQQKPFLIDIYTNWCGWCKHMMRTTYSNPNIANYINTYFYPIKFNAETKDTIEYNAKKYGPTSLKDKGPHELAINFLGNSLSYPSTIFVGNNFEFNLLTQGYLDDKKIEPLLVFMVENIFRTTNYDDFRVEFEKAFYDTTIQKTELKTIEWQDLEKVQKKNPKKILVNISAGFCNSCKIMNKIIYTDTLTTNYIKKNFHIVNLNAESTDTLVYKNEKYFKTLINGYPLHTLALKITNNKLVFPTIAVLDENLNHLDALNYYLTPKAIKPMLMFYAENKFKTTSWQEFLNQYNSKNTKP